MTAERESRSENAGRQASPAARFLAALLLVVVYLLSPPFVIALCHFRSVGFNPVKQTLYAPINILANHAPPVFALLKAYYELVLGWMGLFRP